MATIMAMVTDTMAMAIMATTMARELQMLKLMLKPTIDTMGMDLATMVMAMVMVTMVIIMVKGKQLLSLVMAIMGTMDMDMATMGTMATTMAREKLDMAIMATMGMDMATTGTMATTMDKVLDTSKEWRICLATELNN